MVDDAYWMGLALAEADRAAGIGEVPVGAVVVRSGEVIGRGHNRREIDQDPFAH
ncbi:MAG TPA: deaminase, partial [Thermoanaerobaculia bacterium]|nr:deaminase [Thermoanaerobaculia bacterium]